MIKKKLAAYAVAMTLGLGLVSGSLNAATCDYHEEPTVGEMFADGVVARPMIFIASVVGAAAWVVTLPFTIPSGSAGEAGQSWVLDPLAYTFARPLGDIRTER